MICPSCGASNRPTARFCARCGTALPVSPQPEQAAPPQPQQAASPQPWQAKPPQSWQAPLPQPQPSYAAPASTMDVSKAAGKVTLFGGNALVTIGSLIVLFAFMLPWVSCSSMGSASGFDIATNPADTGEELSSLLMLVPLGALALGALGAAGIGLNIFNRALPPNVMRLLVFTPLLVLPFTACSCIPCIVFFSKIQEAIQEADAWGLGSMIRIEYGFWLTLFGLGMAVLGALMALAGGFLDRQKPP